jgi:hypothetical protein
LAFRIHPDWLPLVGQYVQVRIAGEEAASGRVDAVSADNSRLWVVPGIPHPRRMIERGEQVEVLVDFRWESAREGSP